MQKLIKLSQRVINIQNFIRQSLSVADVSYLSDMMMELALREANNSARNVLEDMVKDMIEANYLNGKDPFTRQRAMESVCGAFHLTEFYNSLTDIMLHLDNVFYNVRYSSTDKFRRSVIHNDFDELDMDVTNIATLWFGATFGTKIDTIFDKYITGRGHYTTIFGNRWPNDLTPLSEQMKIRSVLLLVISVVSMLE